MPPALRSPVGAAALLVCLGPLALTPAVARAESSPAAPSGAATRTPLSGEGKTFTPAELQEAEGRWREARQLYEQGKVEEARVKYAQAFAVLQRPNILWNLAIAEFYSDRKLEALRHFNQFIARGDADPADVKRALEKYVPQAMAATCHVAVDSAAGLTLRLDGEVQPGATPVAGSLHANPGHHRLEARFESRSEVREFQCSAGQDLSVRFNLEGPKGLALAPTSPYPKARTITTIALGASALVGLGLGVGFAIDSQNRDRANADLLSQSPQICLSQASAECNDWRERLDAQQSSATASKIFYVVGGVLGAGAAATWFLWPSPKRKETATMGSLAPTVVRGGAVLQWNGSF